MQEIPALLNLFILEGANVMKEDIVKEIEALKKKISREKQFKKQLELSRVLKPKEEELDKLKY